MKRLVCAFVLGLIGTAAAATPAWANGTLSQPTATPAGTHGGVRYVQYDGIFRGATSTGSYAVPYRITAPAQTKDTNGTALVEPPHFATGVGALDASLGRRFLLSRRFVHAAVGWSTLEGGTTLRILDPSVPAVFVDGGFLEPDGSGRTDYEIVADFGRALAADQTARKVAGRIVRRYAIGFSDSSDPVLGLVTSGMANGVFDLAFPWTTESSVLPEDVMAAGSFGGKMMIVNSEFEEPSTLVDRGTVPNRYRYYAVAGSPHIPDFLIGDFAAGTTPVSYQPELRAHFLQADRWVVSGRAPMASTHLRLSNGQTLDRDANHNAIVVDGLNRPLPRLPVLELGEGFFDATGPQLFHLLGAYRDVHSISELGYSSHPSYLSAFGARLDAYVNAYGITSEDAAAMRTRAALCPPLTYTETYRGHYDAFVSEANC